MSRYRTRLSDNGGPSSPPACRVAPAALPRPSARETPASQEKQMTDSFATRDVLEVNGKRYHYSSLARLGQRFDLARLPYSLKILLENLLRHEDGLNVTAKEIEAVANWDAKKEPDTEIS